MLRQFNSQSNRKEAIIKLLYQMAYADNNLESVEESMIIEIGVKIGMDLYDLERLKGDAQSVNFNPPSGERDRMSILYYLLFLMRANGEITQSEEQFCQKVGFRLGFHPDLISDLIQVMKKYLHDNVPPDEMLEKIRKYLN